MFTSQVKNETDTSEFCSTSEARSHSNASTRRRLYRLKRLVLVLAVVAVVDKLLPRFLASVKDNEALHHGIAEVSRHLQNVANLEWRCTGGGTPAYTSGSAERLLTSGASSSSSSSSSSNSNSTSNAGASSGSSSCGSSAEEACSHPHEAMFYLVNSIMVGTAVSFLVTFKNLAWMQPTVALFCLGTMLSLVLRVSSLTDELGVLGRSYDMWMEIDPHLLLFTLLPPLLAGDAMSIDTTVALRVAKQCVFLAGPGVLCQSLLFAVFLWAYYSFKWEFMLCLTLGSILCATDPVAVVALLKQLGASQILTVQIQGESLLNDGTAIVLYTVAYDMLKGVDYTIEEMIMFLIQSALGAWVFGTVAGYGFFLWIKSVKNHFDHNSSMIQVALTIACAYFNFCVAEGLFKLSGVLATVASSLVLAHQMWGEVVDPHMMHTIWHMLEYMGNTIIFFLAGALFGNVLVRVDIADWGHLILIYVILCLIRFTMLFCSRPLLTCLSTDRIPVRMSDCIVMTWGGLRGAVGLALAIQVNINKADGQMSAADADRILFYVGGVAFLTLIVNATTCPLLVKFLGITAMKDIRQRLILLIHHQMHRKVHDLDDGDVKKALCEVLEEAEGCLRCSLTSNASQPHHAKTAHDLAKNVLERCETKVGGCAAPSEKRTSNNQDLDLDDYVAFEELFKNIDEVRSKLEQADQDNLAVLQGILPPNVLLHKDKQDNFMKNVKNKETDPLMVRAVNKSFLQLVRYHYKEKLELGVFSKSDLAPLLQSIHSAESGNCFDLKDLDSIIVWKESMPPKLKDNSAAADLDPGIAANPSRKKVYKALHTTWFVVSLGFLITTNAVLNLVEPSCDSSTCNVAFFFAEGMFAALFLMEFLIRFYAERLQYFFCKGQDGKKTVDKWSVFDFTLVILSILGFCALSWSWAGQALSFFKLLRCARLVRLIKLRAEVMGQKRHPWNMMLCFIQAHTESQEDLIHYYSTGLNGTSLGCIAEVARCILESQLEVYRAMLVCLEYVKTPEEWGWRQTTTKMIHESHEMGHEMEHFIERAAEGGVLSEVEKEAIIKIIHVHQKKFMGRIQNYDSATPGSEAFGKTDTIGLSTKYRISARRSIVEQFLKDNGEQPAKLALQSEEKGHPPPHDGSPLSISEEGRPRVNENDAEDRTFEEKDKALIATNGRASQAAPKASNKKHKKRMSYVETHLIVDEMSDEGGDEEGRLAAERTVPPKTNADDAAAKAVSNTQQNSSQETETAGSNSEKNTEPMPEPKTKGLGSTASPDNGSDIASKPSAKLKATRKKEETVSDDNDAGKGFQASKTKRTVKKKVKAGGAALAGGQDDSAPAAATIGASTKPRPDKPDAKVLKAAPSSIMLE